MSTGTEPKLHDLLVKTSRTFALSIPPLPEPLRREVTVSYLLFRLADTFEDTTSWPPATRSAALAQFRKLLQRPPGATLAAARIIWRSLPSVGHDGYAELLDDAEIVLRALWDLDPAARQIIIGHIDRTAERMSGFVERTQGERLELEDLDDLRAYCYAVAGIVGELLTDLFRRQLPALDDSEPDLNRLAVAFGEGLQLVNILKDSRDDDDEGRRYLPRNTTRTEVFAVARTDLDLATRYVAALQRSDAPRGLLEFAALPVRLAYATLTRVEASGAGAKLTREEVNAIVAELATDLDAGRPAVQGN